MVAYCSSWDHKSSIPGTGGGVDLHTVNQRERNVFLFILSPRNAAQNRLIKILAVDARLAYVLYIFWVDQEADCSISDDVVQMGG